MVDVESYAPGKWLRFRTDFDASRQKYSVIINGKQALRNADFSRPVQALQRISFRTGPQRAVRLDQSGGGKTGRFDKKHYFVGQIDPLTDHPSKNPAIYYLDDVWSQSK